MISFFKSNTVLLNTKGLSIFGRKPAENSESVHDNSPSPNFEIKRNRFSLKYRRIKSIFSRKILLILVVLLLVICLLAILYISGKNPTNLVQNKAAQQSVQINKSVDFPVRDQKGAATDKKLTMRITTTDKTSQILIQGKPATARSGKTFLIINLELDNPTQSKLGLAPVELIRLLDSEEKKYAPDVHNDKVSIEPLSTKRTRVGFVVDETKNSFNIQFGEVSGKKETVTINFN